MEHILPPGSDIRGVSQVNFEFTTRDPEMIPKGARELPESTVANMRHEERWREVVTRGAERVVLEDLGSDLRRGGFTLANTLYCDKKGDLHIYLVFFRSARYEESKVDRLFEGIMRSLSVFRDANGQLWFVVEHALVDGKADTRFRIQEDYLYQYPVP